MSSYPATTITPAFGSYQAAFSKPVPQIPIPASFYSFSTQTAQLRSSPPPPDLPPPPPDLSSVTPQVASQAFQRLISTQLRNVGFDTAQPAALQRLELEVVAFVEQLHERAHEYANLANRAQPIAKDLIVSCEDFKLQTKDLVAVGSKKTRAEASVLLPPLSRSPSPELLSSDDEGAIPIIPMTLRGLPRHLPGLPPKHTYLRTPASPPNKKAALPSLDKKLKNAGLVQESLKNLLLATDDSSGQEDGELLGHIVNWEASVHPRKRWKVGI